MLTLASVLAFGWAPEIRGFLFVMIAVGVMIGGSYLLLATNLGARLGLLITITALAGWIASMGAIWWTYGIGLQGKFPSWQAREIINDGNVAGSKITTVAAIGDPVTVPQGTHAKRCESLVAPVDKGWVRLAPDDSSYGQAAAAADDIILNKAAIFKAGEYQVTNVFDEGGQRYPLCFGFDTSTINLKFGRWHFDYAAFLHQPHYSVVEIRPLVPQRTEPGRPPPRPVIDQSQPPRYVVMERNRGHRRYPSAFISIGSGIIFALCCLSLHRRDKLAVAHVSGVTEAEAKVPATTGA